LRLQTWFCACLSDCLLMQARSLPATFFAPTPSFTHLPPPHPWYCSYFPSAITTTTLDIIGGHRVRSFYRSSATMPKRKAAAAASSTSKPAKKAKANKSVQLRSPCEIHYSEPRDLRPSLSTHSMIRTKHKSNFAIYRAHQNGRSRC
jgi:hypothetical protein